METQEKSILKKKEEKEKKEKEEKNKICEYCHAKFSSKNNLYWHLQTCLEKYKNIILEKENIILEKEKTIARFTSDIIKLKDKWKNKKEILRNSSSRIKNIVNNNNNKNQVKIILQSINLSANSVRKFFLFYGKEVLKARPRVVWNCRFYTKKYYDNRGWFADSGMHRYSKKSFSYKR